MDHDVVWTRHQPLAQDSYSRRSCTYAMSPQRCSQVHRSRVQVVSKPQSSHPLLALCVCVRSLTSLATRHMHATGSSCSRHFRTRSRRTARLRLEAQSSMPGTKHTSLCVTSRTSRHCSSRLARSTSFTNTRCASHIAHCATAQCRRLRT